MMYFHKILTTLLSAATYFIMVILNYKIDTYSIQLREIFTILI